MIEDPTADYRQLAGIDTAGTTAAPSGQHTIGIHQIAHGDGAVAAGNLLAVPDVIDAMLGGYLHSRHTDLVERLLDGLAGAAAAGGETGPVHSAGRVALHPSAGWASTDLRVDWHDDPIGEIRTLRQLWQPQREDYITRNLDPSGSPAYGVPGDL